MVPSAIIKNEAVIQKFIKPYQSPISLAFQITLSINYHINSNLQLIKPECLFELKLWKSR